MTRQLSDRIEHYNEIIKGQCSCGELVHKVTGSTCTIWKTGERYHYPADNTAWSIFRCRKCMQPIHESFRPLTIGQTPDNL